MKTAHDLVIEAKNQLKKFLWIKLLKRFKLVMF